MVMRSSLRIRFFTPREAKHPSTYIRSMKDWPAEWDKPLEQLMPTHTNQAIGKLLGATPGLVGFRIQKLGLSRSPEAQQRLYSALTGRLLAGANKANQQAPGTCKWIKKHPKRPSEKPEWWIFLGNAERMPLRRYLWQTWIGPIPKGYNICFADGNTRRCTLENLICIPNNEMAKRNRLAIQGAMFNRAYWLTPAAKESQIKRSASLAAFWKTPEGKQVLARRSDKIRQMNAEGLINNPFRNLHDHVVAFYLAPYDPAMQQYILEQEPGLLELKRAEVLLKRQLKAVKNDDAS